MTSAVTKLASVVAAPFTGGASLLVGQAIEGYQKGKEMKKEQAAGEKKIAAEREKMKADVAKQQAEQKKLADAERAKKERGEARGAKGLAGTQLTQALDPEGAAVKRKTLGVG